MADTRHDIPSPFHPISHRNNMMVVRYVLCIYVILGHIMVLTNKDIPWMDAPIMAVGGFFALSGFLLFPSFQKKQTLRHYISRRARRILPPYVLIVVLCTTTLWSVSNFSITEYLQSQDTWQYLVANLSFLNFLHPTLPGVFTGPEYVTPAVNGSLWTMKGEWVCYLSVPLIFSIISRGRRKAGIIVLSSIICVTIFSEWILLELAESTANRLYSLLAKQFGTMIVFFYIGALINYLLPTFIKYRWWLFSISLVCIFAQDYIPLYHLIVLPFATSILTLFISLTGSWGVKLSRDDNVSYDMYLFHFPIIQLFIFFGLPEKLPLWIFALSTILLTYIAGMFSWNLVGKHILRQN